MPLIIRSIEIGSLVRIQKLKENDAIYYRLSVQGTTASGEIQCVKRRDLEKIHKAIALLLAETPP